MNMLKKVKNLVRNQAVSPWLSSQYIPISTINKSLLRDNAFVTGEYEIYQPDPAPESNLAQTKELKFHIAPKIIAPHHYYKIQNALVTGTHVMDPASPGTVYIETLPEISLFSRRLGGQLRCREIIKCRFSRFFEKQKIPSAYLLSNGWWKNYYHFVTDVLLRYDALWSVDSESLNALPLLIHEEPTAWQKEYFDLLGIQTERLISTRNKLFEVRELTISGPRRERFWCSPNAVNRFREKMVALALASAESGSIGSNRFQKQSSELIYVSRAAARYRRVENEEQLLPLLEKRGFKIVKLEDMSVREQILTFAKARMVVAPHGAGLTNLIYSQNPTLIELFPEDCIHQGFYITLAFACGGQHYPIIGQPVDKDNNYKIDASELEALLDNLLEKNH